MDVQKYDGFISMREDGAAFAKALVSWMEHNLTIRPAHQQRIGGPDHVKTAQEFIVSTHFTVIVIGPSKLDRNQTGTLTRHPVLVDFRVLWDAQFWPNR